MIHHTVLFSSKSADNTTQIIDGLRLLSTIPNVENFMVGANLKLDAQSTEFDVVLHCTFANKNALTRFKQHATYQQAIDIVRPLRLQRIVVDIAE